jgi:hypothetical protein
MFEIDLGLLFWYYYVVRRYAGGTGIPVVIEFVSIMHHVYLTICRFF